MVAMAAAGKGKWVAFESPVARDADSPFAVEGREDHAAMWHDEAMRQLEKKFKMERIYFDQCVTGCEYEKTTMLLATPDIAAHLRPRFHMRFCHHPPGTHKHMPSEPGATEDFISVRGPNT